MLLLIRLGLARAEPLPPIAIGFDTPVIQDLPGKGVEGAPRFWVEGLARSLGLRETHPALLARSQNKGAGGHK